MANKGELPYGVSSSKSKSKFGLREKIEFVPVLYVFQTSLQNELYGRFRTGCKEKRTGRGKFFVFHLLIGLIAVAVTVTFVVAPRICRCA